MVMEELENMEELEAAEEWQEANLLVRSSAGGVAKGTVPWPPTQLIPPAAFYHRQQLGVSWDSRMGHILAHHFLARREPTSTRMRSKSPKASACKQLLAASIRAPGIVLEAARASRYSL